MSDERRLLTAERLTLSGAADLIGSLGLARGVACDPAGPICTAEAIRRAAPDRNTEVRAVILLCRHLNVTSIPRWSDARTAQEVVTALRGAAIQGAK